MGRIFPFILFWLLSNQGFAQEIALPPARPPSVPPPNVDNRQRLEESLDKKRGIRERRRDKVRARKKAEADHKTRVKRHLMNEKTKGLMELGLSIPYVSTSGDRDRYQLDLFATSFRFNWRHNSGKFRNDSELWYGFRFINFNGTGVSEGLAGRFGFFYFGPMIGLGKIDPPGAHTKQEAGTKEKRQVLSDGSGFFWMSGLALQSRFVEIDPGEANPRGDFDVGKGVSLDGTGLWTEFSYHWIVTGTINHSARLGVQHGDGKVFVYLGYGFGGFF